MAWHLEVACSMAWRGIFKYHMWSSMASSSTTAGVVCASNTSGVTSGSNTCGVASVYNTCGVASSSTMGGVPWRLQVPRVASHGICK